MYTMDANDSYSMNILPPCRICLAPATCSNYGVISCSPCKMFFKRNAVIHQEKFKCHFDGQCQININNRHVCSSCRLEKCFACGMQIELIRGSRLTKNSKRKINKTEQINVLTSNLLQTDQSILNIDQCNLLSNLMLSYDEHSALSLAERFLSEQNILPFKLRFKCGSVQKFLGLLINKIQLLFEKNPHFCLLYSHDRSILLHHQMKYLILFNLSYIVQQSHLFDYPAFTKTIETLFGRIIFLRNSFDILFMKLSLVIICFSSFDYTIDTTNHLINSKSIIKIQDLYVELAWRYLIYVYDEKKAINCFMNLIRCIINHINDMFHLRERRTFMDMINSVIKQIEHSFIKNC